MKKYNLINIILGWFSFLIAIIVLLMTIEPTTSFWDCGEFIATAFKLEVGHPPGAPFFMLLGRFFSLFATDVTQVAKMVNIQSALAGAFTILFLFWTITHLAKKMIVNLPNVASAKSGNSDMNTGQLFAIMGSGLVGALAYTFSDTFWFSATEGEVYAISSFFTAFVFWAILKWENVAHQKYSNRWIILIAYLMGISIGIHLLNLLAIPAIVFVYYFKKYEVTRKGIIQALLVAVVILGAIMYGIIPGIVKLASKFELFFINTIHLPYNSGIIIYALLLVGGIVWGLYYTMKKNKVVLNTIILAFTVIMIGYSSFAIIVIRSLANPPMDENNPENIFALYSYLQREQYGDRPLIKGQYYNAPPDRQNPYLKGSVYYIKKDGRYVVSDVRDVINYDSKFTTVFPRMYSAQPNHIKAYKRWGNIKGTPVSIINNQGKQEVVQRPTFGENLKFFFKYQVGHMYFRYFMWNFAGRQNDIQGHGSIIEGNWLCGIPFIDEARLGPQDKLPESMKTNKAMNKYYLLPFILGLVGLFFHYKNDSKNFWVVMLLYFFTGIAVIIYLNQYPYQPRERDYAYAASFYAFTIWIGLGVFSIYKFLNKKLPSSFSAILSTLLCLILVPVILANENWDDHDRSRRYTARDFAKNYLNSCAPNAILFTNGDNDTFPLWYVQEVEGVRTDVRVCNLSLLNTDWYIDQMKRKAYDSDPVPFSLTYDKYIQGKRDYVPFFERFKDFVDLKQIMEFVASDDPGTKLGTQGGGEIDYIPSKYLSIAVDSAKVVSNGTVKPELAAQIVSSIDWSPKKSYVMKNDLMVLDLLATNNWERPVYFAITVGHASYLKLEEYFQLEGLAYRLVPIKTKNRDGQIGRIDTDIMYDNMMNKFVWGGIDDPEVFLDENNLRMTMNLRNNFARLANALLVEGKRDSAIAVLDRCMELMPHNLVPYNYFNIGLADAYYKANEHNKANEIIKKLAEISRDDLDYYLSLKGEYSSSVKTERKRAMTVMQELVRITRNYKQTELNKELEEQFQRLFVAYSAITE